MFRSLQALLAPALVERMVLMANHVLASEPVATERLRPHAGRSIGVEWTEWPGLLPAPPVLLFHVTPAGLLEWTPDGGAPALADLVMRIDARRPLEMLAQVAAGGRVPMEVQGDAALAADVNWLVDNVRWDVEADLARVIDPRLAHEVAGVSRALVKGLRFALSTGAGWAARWRAGRT
ncbi:hypothetical protein V4F39_21585 [Aquincola sp. MAHUQ-54]|uniref:Ubiquinone biosynthesis protein UbiJ n=1 Tax=Aquincola agrisoli TaxID=3119538 RepID=A0AAW9QJI0_9BURK